MPADVASLRATVKALRHPRTARAFPSPRRAEEAWGEPELMLLGLLGKSRSTFSYDDRDIHMMETEADKMSMDGSASASCSEAPDDDVVMNDDPEDVTDDEDWASHGGSGSPSRFLPQHGCRSVGRDTLPPSQLSRSQVDFDPSL